MRIGFWANIFNSKINFTSINDRCKLDIFYFVEFLTKHFCFQLSNSCEYNFLTSIKNFFFFLKFVLLLHQMSKKIFVWDFFGCILNAF